MGLDMYLNATGKNHRRVQELARERAKEFEDFSSSLYTSEKYSGLADLPCKHGYVEYDKLTNEQRKLVAEFKFELMRKAHSLEGILRKGMTYAYLVKKEESDPVHEIGYWRKEWTLHQFIVENFGDKDNDNCTEIYLDEAALTKIIGRYKDPECDYCEPFRKALDIVKDGGVVFYWAWY